MTALLPHDLVVDIVASVRRLGGLGDHLSTTDQFFLAEELRTDRIDAELARHRPGGWCWCPRGFCGWPLYRLVSA
jgi:hypothetical protein